jgi:hypothetical protein
MVRSLLACALALTPAVSPAAAAAQEPTIAEREVPDYDGRGDDPTTAGEVALWVPRVVLSPLYLVSEFVVRRPLGFLVTEAEENDLPAILVDFFTFGPEKKAGLVPTALFDFGFRPSIGVYGFGDDFVADGNDLRLYFAWGGSRWLSGTITDRITITEGVSDLSFRFSSERRPDWIFHGVGPRSDDDDEATYEQTRHEVAMIFAADLPSSSEVETSIGVADVSFDDRGCCGDPGVGDLVAQGRFADVPPGFDGYTKIESAVFLAFDSRAERGQGVSPGTGVRLELEGAHGFDTRDLGARSWIRYGGTLGGYWDPSGHNRTLSLSVTALFADPLGAREVPFTEQIILGGTRLMRGFLEGRLVGRSAFVTTFEYRWPIWIWLDGSFHVAAGNVFGERLDGISFDQLRLSTGLGLRAVTGRDHSFDFLVGLGSEPIDELELTSVRVVVGATRGF